MSDDGFWDNPFGGLFDFDGDGKEDMGEQWLAFKMFRECAKDDDTEWADDDDFDDYDEFAWRQNCEDGSEFGIDPYEYETEAEYEEALDDARLERDMTDVPSPEVADDDGAEEIKEPYYPNKRQYKAAAILAGYYIYVNAEYEKTVKDRCRFILEQNGKLIAANYLTPDGDFLFSQAVKDNFAVPVTLPDEDETSEFSPREILNKIQRKDIPLALKVWDWMIEQFLDYADYSVFGRGMMTDGVLDDLYKFSDEFCTALRAYLNDHADFRTKLVRQSDEMPRSLAELIVNMIKDGFTETAKAMFDDGLCRAEGKWRQVNDFMSGTILYAKDNEELETIEFVEENFLPKMNRYSDGMILDEIEVWQQEITEQKQEVERRSEKYAFSRSNAWRNTVPDGSEYGLDPRWYDTEQEYLDRLQQEKYAWRERVAARDTLGLDPTRFETRAEYDEAWKARYNAKCEEEWEERKRQRELLRQQREAEAVKREESLKNELQNDETVYTYCGVKLPCSEHPYTYRTNGNDLKIGDTVVVPFGKDDKEMTGIIVSIGHYARIGVPFPLEKTKFILRKIEQ